MNKTVMGFIVAIVIVLVLGTAVFFYMKGTDDSKESNNANVNETTNNNQGNVNDNDNVVNNIDEDNDKISGGKVLVVYYSATSNTKSVAEKIASNLDADLFEIEPEDEYTSEDLNYNNSNSRVSREHNDKSLQDVKLVSTSVNNWDSYDTVLIGYPIWWGVAAWPVDSFVKANDFSGKTVIPFCTSVSSGIGESDKLLEAEAKGGNWMSGQRFSSRPSDAQIKEFTDSIK